MIGRPNISDAAPYYFTYINQITGEDVLGVLAIQLEETLAFCAGISEEQSLYRYAENKWSIRQVLNHVTDSERVFSFRALWFARGFETALPSFDQNISASTAQAARISWTRHVEEFRRVRLSSISLFANMPAEAWGQRGAASGNSFTVRALAYIVAGHLTHHLKSLREKYCCA